MTCRGLGEFAALLQPHARAIEAVVKRCLQRFALTPGNPPYELSRFDGEDPQLTVRWVGWQWPLLGHGDHYCLVAVNRHSFLETPDEAEEGTSKPSHRSLYSGVYPILIPPGTGDVYVLRSGRSWMCPRIYLAAPRSLAHHCALGRSRCTVRNKPERMAGSSAGSRDRFWMGIEHRFRKREGERHGTTLRQRIGQGGFDNPRQAEQLCITHCRTEDSLFGEEGFAVRAASSTAPELMRPISFRLEVPGHQLPLDLWSLDPSPILALGVRPRSVGPAGRPARSHPLVLPQAATRTTDRGVT